MREKDDMRDKIENFTQYIRTRLNLSSPVNMFDVMQALNINCKAVEDVDYDAKLSGNKDEGYCVSYDKNQLSERQQFSIAHELGHLLLHKIKNESSKKAYYRKIGNNSRLEWEANEFAAALLMPREEFINVCMNNADAFGNVDLNVVANNFGVSKQAARVRGSVLKLWIM